MDRLLAIIPKNLLAFVIITVGIFVIVLSQPPHTVCDSQIEVLNKSEKSFLFKDSGKPNQTQSTYVQMRDYCKTTNSPGGCFELFDRLKVLLQDMDSLSPECMATIGGIAQYRQVISESLKLMVRLAWGEAPPTSYYGKFGWLESADLSLFCRLKKKFVAMYGKEDWSQYREQIMRSLPKSKDMSRDQIWDMSILSENCARYP